MNKSYHRALEIYKIFTESQRVRWLPNGEVQQYLHIPEGLDFSEEAKYEMYQYETFGEGDIGLKGIFGTQKKMNAYFYGKRMMDITLKMWYQSLDEMGVFFLMSLYQDKDFPHWWLDKIFKNFYKEHSRAKELVYANRI